jgi:poly(3-hydroxybutyrate) depolymerase
MANKETTENPAPEQPAQHFFLLDAGIYLTPDPSPITKPQTEPDAPINRYLPKDFAIVHPGDMSVPGDHRKSFDLEGHEREFEVHTPQGYDGSRALPVFFVFHGLLGSIDEMKYVTALNKLADEKGFAVVYTQALRKPLPGSGLAHQITLGLFPTLYGPSWNSDHGSATDKDPSYDDLDYVKAVNGIVFDQLKVDPKKLYLVGFSEGGIFAQYVQEKLKIYAGFASVKSTHLDGDPKPTPDAAAAAMVLLGDDDNALALYGGHGWGEGWRPLKGFLTITIPKVAQSEPLEQAPMWAQANGCTTNPPPKPEITKYNDISIWNCGKHAPVEQIVRKHSFYNWGLRGGQHVWDGMGADGKQNYGWWGVREPNPTQDDTRDLVDFLLKYEKPDV